MMRKIESKSIALCFLALTPAFLIWVSLLRPVFLPAVTLTGNFLLTPFLSELDVSLSYDDRRPGVVIESERLFKAKRSWPNNSYAPNLEVTGATQILLGNFEGITLGLPLFWSFLFLLGGNKLRYAILGSVAIFVCASLSGVFITLHAIAETVAEDQTLHILTGYGYVKTPMRLEMWQLRLLGTLRDVMTIGATLVGPPLIAYLSRKGEESE